MEAAEFEEAPSSIYFKIKLRIDFNKIKVYI